MTDTMTPEQRHRYMSHISSRNTDLYSIFCIPTVLKFCHNLWQKVRTRGQIPVSY